MFLNTRRMTVATSYKNHLARALRILEFPPDVAGHVVERGCYKGGSATNLSFVCRITGRKLVLFDSFQGLPKGHPDDRLFGSERWWRENFATTPPGMIGSGCGLPLGTYHVGPWEERFHYPLQKPNIVVYTRKGMSGYWSFYPEGRA